MTKKIGERQFYQQVGGPNARIPRIAGASIICRLLDTQIRCSLRVDPRHTDKDTAELIHLVDQFYDVRVKNCRIVAKDQAEPHLAKEYFEASGIPDDALQLIRGNLDRYVKPFQRKRSDEVNRVRKIRESAAEELSGAIVRAKLEQIGFRK